MGTAQSSPASGLVTVSQRAADSRQDPDLAALQRLPPVAPLVKPPTLRGLFSTRTDPGLPSLHPRNLSALCREYASLSRHAALPICEEQRVLAKKMSGVEALCARVLYLMALRSTELTSSASTLRDIAAVEERMNESQAVLQQCVARAERLERMLPAEGGVLER